MRRLGRWPVAMVSAAMALVALPALAGCADGEDTHSRWPAAAAGPACQLIEYEVVAAHLGTQFDTAGGARDGETITCALTQGEQELPDLTLAVTPSAADEVIFQVTMLPSGSTLVEGLGRIAYRLVVKPTATRGPAAEIGWLSHDGRLLILRYTGALDAQPDEVAALPARLLALAQQIDQGPAAA